jgi:cell wall-associated NlpC family hydrolase
VPRHIRRTGLIALAATTLLGGLARPAGADPISDAQAQAQQLQAQIAANNERIDALGQQADAAQLRLDQAQQAIADTQAKLTAAQRQLDALQARVRERAASAYRGAVSGQSLNALELQNADDLLIGQKYSASQASADASLLNQLDAARAQLDGVEATAEKAKAQADADEAQINASRQSLAAANAQQGATLNQVQGQLVALVAQAQQRAAAAALAAAGGSGDPSAFPNLAPTSGATAKAIEFARAQIGKPYEYAASGPDSYDCSGLVMAAYRSAGVMLPHYSGAMYALLPHVALSAAQPGDLFFWGSGGSEHVAFFLGGGRLLEAGGSGNDVHIGPIWAPPSGAARVVG